MSDSDIAEEVDIEEVEAGGGKIKRVAAALGVLAVLFVVLKLRGRGGSSDGESSSSVERVDEDDERGIDTVSTKDSDDDDDESSSDKSLEVKTSSGSGVGGRFDDLDLVDYLAIFAAALQSARDEYRIRTER
ncbi:hypothetical protein ACFPYI_15665 [Halomarina salina]|uniref:Uncharacterized protein n=1 Tax=Halomarina salina TaxID=1872699 RepID=A0ABD5RR44_9EURY|nr:hypothetical protein [Halomarina salina]